jgi:hypothetical protein
MAGDVYSIENGIQSERSIGAARIKDILYIFNGTYPMYYTGDGQLYMFPEYQPSFSEQVVAGHNTLMDDFEDYYYGRNFKELPDNVVGQINDVTDFHLQPRIPYQLKAEGDTEDQMELRLSYTYLSKYLNPFIKFLPDNYVDDVETFADLPSENQNTTDIYFVRQSSLFYRWVGTRWFPIQLSSVPGIGSFYEMKAKVYFRETAPGVTSQDWIEVSENNYTTDILQNANASSNFETALFTFEPNQATATFDRQKYFTVKINNISSGLKDIRVDLIIERTGYRQNFTGIVGGIQTFIRHDFQTTVEFNESLIFEEVEITATKLQNYPTIDEPDRGGFRLRAPWTCNNVIDHYGKLLAWGSLGEPERLFISSVENFAYFPYNYTVDFTSELKEQINSVVPFMNILVVQSDSYTWGLKGSSPQIYIDDQGIDLNPLAYEVITINSSVGSIAPKSVRPIRNRLYFLSQEGLMELTSLFATDDRYNVKPIDRNIYNLIPQDKDAVAMQFDNQYWIHFPSTGQTFRYYIDKQAWVKDSFNFDTFNGIYRYYNKNGKLHFVTHPMTIESGNAKIYEGVVDYGLATDFDQPITSQFLTSKMNQEYPFHWKRYKELKLDFTVQNQYMPNKTPISYFSEGVDFDFNVAQVNFSSNDLIKNHSYTFDFGILFPANTTVTVNDFPQENISIKVIDEEENKGMIRFTLPNEVPEIITITFPNDNYTEEQVLDFAVVDDTYDNGLVYDLRVTADNNTMIRDDYGSYIPMSVLQTIDTGTGFNKIVFGNTNFGDVTTFVQTTKLYGNGYDINMYYKDESNIKWTLETMGIAYKMRRTRSDKRG